MTLKLQLHALGVFYLQNICVKVVAILSNVTSKKLPNVYESCPKMIALEK